MTCCLTPSPTQHRNPDKKGNTMDTTSQIVIGIGVLLLLGILWWTAFTTAVPLIRRRIDDRIEELEMTVHRDKSTINALRAEIAMHKENTRIYRIELNAEHARCTKLKNQRDEANRRVLNYEEDKVAAEVERDDAAKLHDQIVYGLLATIAKLDPNEPPAKKKKSKR